MPEHIASWWFTQCIVINALTVASYMGVWVVIKFKTGKGITSADSWSSRRQENSVFFRQAPCAA